MPLFDMPLEDMQNYRPPLPEPADFDSFWKSTLAAARSHDLNPRFEPVDVGLRTLDVFDVSFAGFNGQPVKGWYMLPKNARSPLPAVVEFIGYSGGRGYPTDWLAFPSAGFAYMVMDTRGQGSGWRRGDTADLPNGANPSLPGFMTQGILDPQTYFYRRLYTDAARAIDAIRSRGEIDPARIAVTGSSQGGGLSIAAAGLTPDLDACLPDVPFLSHFRRAVEITPHGPYPEIAGYLSVYRDRTDVVFNTLKYFDGLNFAARMTASAYYSVAVMDTICPPSTVYASYNHVSTEKDIKVYYFNNHEGGGSDHLLEKIRYLRQRWQ